MAIAALSAVILLLVLALVEVTYQSRAIAKERDNAERLRLASDAITNYMVSMFDRAGGNGKSDQKTPPAKEDDGIDSRPAN
jgi:hypothetical protein